VAAHHDEYGAITCRAGAELSGPCQACWGPAGNTHLGASMARKHALEAIAIWALVAVLAAALALYYVHDRRRRALKADLQAALLMQDDLRVEELLTRGADPGTRRPDVLDQTSLHLYLSAGWETEKDFRGRRLRFTLLRFIIERSRAHGRVREQWDRLIEEVRALPEVRGGPR